MIGTDDNRLHTESKERLNPPPNLVQHIVGDLGSSGGHGTRAGGHILLKNQEPSWLSDLLIEKTLVYLKGDPTIEGILLI